MRKALCVLALIALSCAGETMKKETYRQLSPEEERVIISKGTEAPFSGKYNNLFGKGVYHCKRCGAPLYESDSKFRSSCGWPSFDDEIPGAVKRVPDADGQRIEIVCAACGAHLGHVFEGEGLTSKNLRHCVNSISMEFRTASANNLKKAWFAGGCFWGVEYYFSKKAGVISAVSGFMGGLKPNPSYNEVSAGDTGHIETVEIIYDPSIVSYEELAKYFFEIHNPEQDDGQGPDIGEQYVSAVFFTGESEKQTVRKLIDILENKGLRIATRIVPASEFWKAEEYHQDYYEKKGNTPYCHFYRKRF